MDGFGGAVDGEVETGADVVVARCTAQARIQKK